MSVVETIDSVAGMFQPRCVARGAEICVAPFEDFSLPIPADDLRQILTNLVSNACDALPATGGAIRIECGCSAGKGTIAIADNGHGIPPEYMERIFEPFFTTKNDVGTGIGLWVSRDLVEKNGGMLSVETENLPAGFRTRFRVELPCG